jgi:GPH family glycoside/pentoside/hexuronide:cation symporter
MIDRTTGGLASAASDGMRAGDAVSAGALSKLQLLAFASPALPLAAMLLPIGFLLPPFYTGEMGISLTAWGLIMLVTRLVDAFTDPLVGMFCDRRPSRWGRRRHWVVIATPLLMLGAAMLLMPSLFGGQVDFAYLLVGMLILNLGYTVKGLNTSAWGGELTDDYHERSRVMGWRAAVGAIAPFVAIGIPAAMEQMNPQATTADKLMAVGWFVLLLTPLTTLWSILAVGERRDTQQSAAWDGPSVWASLKAMFANRPMRRLVTAMFIEGVPSSVLAALTVFFLRFVVEAPHLAATILLIPFTAILVGVPIWMRIARGREKHKVIACGNFIHALSLSCIVFVGPGDVALFGAILFVGGFCVGTNFLGRSIMADIVDKEVAETGIQSTGTYFAVAETMAKLAPYLAVAAIYPMLQALGFDPTGKANTPQSIAALRNIFAFAPTVPLLICAWLMWRFPLGSKEQAELRDQIAARRGAVGQEL